MKLSPEERAKRIAEYEDEIKANRWLIANGNPEIQSQPEARIKQYKARIAALQ
ncbi:hypothetical protein J7E62_31590 [Variovorax paradoxus]|nr:hypothetical protein [Variovorax paradoxus]